MNKIKIDYQIIYEKVIHNKKQGISINETIYNFLGHNDTGNFYKSLTNEQKITLRNIEHFSDTQKNEFKKLYFEEGYTMSQLRKKYKIRTKTAIDFVNSISNEYSRSYKNKLRKLTKYQVIKILIEKMKYDIPNNELAKKYNVSASNISNICAGRHWRHIFQGVKKKYNNEILSIAK